MATITRDVTLDCPPERVFDVLSVVERLPEFSDMTVAVRNGPGRPIRPGDTFEQVVKIMGVEVETDWTVTEVTPGSLIRCEGRSTADGRATLTHHLVPSGTGTHLTFEVHYEPPLGILGKLADSLLLERKGEEDAEQILAKLKEVCERAAA